MEKSAILTDSEHFIGDLGVIFKVGGATKDEYIIGRGVCDAAAEDGV
jgi:hypothetical protein